MAASAAFRSLALGFVPLVRAELLFGTLATFAGASIATARLGKPMIPRLVLSIAIALAVPALHGAVNLAVFGEFVPFRVQGSQNLLEAVGQFPNPYGIEYSDEWFAEFARERGVDYGSADADRLAMRWYNEILCSNPGLLFDNFRARLDLLSHYVRLPVGVVTLALCGLGTVAACVRYPRWLAIYCPVLFTLGLTVFVAWVHFMPRLSAPIHFLAPAAVCVGFAAMAPSAFVRLVRAWQRWKPVARF